MREKKKVLLIGNFFNESHSMNIYADELFSNLSGLTDSVHFFKPNSSKKRFKLLYKYFYFPFVIIGKKNIGVYHILDHSYGFLVYFLRLFRPGKTVIVSCHDLTPLYDQENILNRARFSSISYFLWKTSIKGMAKADLIIANSNHLKQIIIKYLRVKEQKIKVVYLGVKSCIENSDLDRYVHKIPEDGFIILSVGTNEKRKNINTMLKVFIEVCKEVSKTNVHFVRVGECLNDDQKKIISDAGLSDKVVELGAMNYNALSLLYRKSDCLLFISTDEGFSLTCTEAMNNNLPVIASNVSSLPEVIGDGGILVSPFDIEGAKEAILKIMTDKEAVADLKAKAKSRVALFSWSNSGKSVMEIYTSIGKAI